MRQAFWKRERVIWTIKLAAALGLLYLALRWFEQRQTYQPSRTIVSSVKDAQPHGEAIELRVGRAEQIRTWWIPCREEARYPDWLILFSHGNAGNLSHRQDFYQTWLTLGFNILAYDYEGYGESSGRPTEAHLYRDQEAVYEHALKLGFPSDRILLLGKSLGGGVASELATRKPAAGLILHSTFTSVPDIGAEMFPILPVRTLSTIRHDTRSRLPRIQVPVLILHSREDGLIGYHHAERNLEAASEPKWLFPISGEHNGSEWDRRETLQAAMDTFMQHLDPNPRQSSSASSLLK